VTNTGDVMPVIHIACPPLEKVLNGNSVTKTCDIKAIVSYITLILDNYYYCFPIVHIVQSSK